jgi:drug/metabolite transporter (DMT)-like permease
VLKRIDAIGLVGIALLAVGLLFFFFSRGNPDHPNIWRDWLLAFVLVMVGAALAIAWPLIRLTGTAEEDEQAKSNAPAQAAGGRPGS